MAVGKKWEYVGGGGGGGWKEGSFLQQASRKKFIPSKGTN